MLTCLLQTRPTESHGRQRKVAIEAQGAKRSQLRLLTTTQPIFVTLFYSNGVPVPELSSAHGVPRAQSQLITD